MILHTVVVSYQRLEELQRTIESYRDTVTVPHRLIVVDNGSERPVRRWLDENIPLEDVVFLGENLYPGYATNYGFAWAGANATHLHRSDSDMEYLPHWCDELQDAFDAGVNLEPKGRLDWPLGIVGLRTSLEEEFAIHNTGGTAAIARGLWDTGIRYRIKTWRELQGFTEDYWICRDALKYQWGWGRVLRPCVRHLAPTPADPAAWEIPYYAESYGIRGIERPDG